MSNKNLINDFKVGDIGICIDNEYDTQLKRPTKLTLGKEYEIHYVNGIRVGIYDDDDKRKEFVFIRFLKNGF